LKLYTILISVYNRFGDSGGCYGLSS